MLFHSSIRRELARSFGATLVVLITIVMTIILIRTLGQATRGSVNPSEVMMVMGYTVLGHLPTILTLSLFIAMVGTLSRMFSDSEMAIWFSSGKGLTGFVAPLLRFAWPVLLAVAVGALLVWPWSNQQIEDLKDRYERRGDVERIAPGQFQESASGKRVFFIDKDAPDSQSGTSVFIYDTERGREILTSARSGRIERRADGRYLVLEHGQRIENTLAHNEARVSEFEEYTTRIGDAITQGLEAATPRSIDTAQLLRDPTPANLGELSWRVGLSLAAVNLVVLALAVSAVNPRVGRSGNLLFAIFAFIVYYNLINMGRSWIAYGRADLVVYLLQLHGAVFLAGLLWLAQRHFNWSLGVSLRRLRGRTGAA